MTDKKAEPKWWEKREEPKTIWQPCKTSDGLDYYYNSVTGETSWEKPAELMSPDELDGAGDWFWIPDEKKAFVPGKVKDKSKKTGTAELEDGTTRSVEIGKLEPLKRSSLQRIVDDLVLLDSMSPPLILNNLKVRYEKNLIYTNIGTILISVNPYQLLPIYTKAVIEDYINRGVKEMAPHVYNVAHDAYWGLKEFSQNQSIIISGESGAGKTEATKRCLDYLAAIAGSVGGVEKKILDANPILEAFGNAKTIRNDNSSRFGKFIQIFFSDKTEINASTTENYLLEKIRVIQQAENERNFHIFYQLSKAAGANERKKYLLGQPGEYEYLKRCIDVPTVNDPKDFADVQKAFKTLTFSDDEVDSLFATVAAVLSLGNVKFGESKGDKGMKTDIPDKKWVTNAANLLKVDVGRLMRSLTVRELRIKGQATTDVILTPKEASDIRDALAKFLYGNMFDWLVQRINKSMIQPSSSKARYIGILDIFGFEIFKHNSFEQLCINFTNEMLQQHFNQQTFKLEEAVYTREKIKFKHVEFIDNQPMLDLITKRPDGILPCLDEELVVPKGTDKTFVDKLHTKQAKNTVYKKFLKDPNFFVIKHYAGEVVYDTFGFLEKNKDTLTTDLLEMLVTSKSPFINTLFPEKELASQDKKASLSKQFQNQLSELMAALNKTEPHYIRCVKPNPDKAPNLFVSVMSYEQLTYSGVFEAVAIRKQGFPFRLPHDVFASRYDCINTAGGGDHKGKCQGVIKSLSLSLENIQMGATMMLYRAEEHRKLELNRNIKLMTIEINNNLERLCQIDTSKMGKDEKEDYFNKLARQVRQADEFRMKTAPADKARALLEAFVEARMDPETKGKLDKAFKEMDQALLEAALAICSANGYRTKLTRACQELLEKVKDAEGAMAMASREMEIEYLNKALKMCEEFKYNRPSVQACRNLLNNIHTANSRIDAAKISKDHTELEETIAFCDSFYYNKPQVEEARELYRQVMQVRSGLESAKAAVEQGALEGAVYAADQLGYQNYLVDECRGLLHRVTRINQEATAACATIEEAHVRAVVKAADEIGQATEWLEYFRGLVKGDYAAFVEAQEKKAIENKTHDRAIRLGIKRKDLLIEKTGMQFSFEKYPKLRPAKDWAEARFLHLGDKIGNLDERIAIFLCWQKDKVHTPLCDYKRAEKKELLEVKKKSRNAHGQIIAYMGMKEKNPKLYLKLQEAIKDGLEEKEIRAEFFIYLIKQLNKNPEPTSDKAWELFAIFLSVFPPNPDFENYLEHYFRQSGNVSSAERWKCKGLLRRRCYEGQQSLPSPNDLENVSSFMTQRLRGFTEPEVKNPSYTDLLSPYTGGGGGGGRGGGGGGKWKKEKDPSSGQFYYINTQTNESQWDKPADYVEPGSGPKPKPSGPVGGGPKGPSGPIGRGGPLGGAGGPKPGAGGGGRGIPMPQPKPTPAIPKPASSEKKAKWKKEKDPSSGEFYYINTETNTSQWDTPADYEEPAPAPAPVPVGGGGTGSPVKATPSPTPTPSASKWKKEKDPGSGEFYYINTQTNESQWEAPPDYVEPGAGPKPTATPTPAAGGGPRASGPATGAGGPTGVGRGAGRGFGGGGGGGGAVNVGAAAVAAALARGRGGGGVGGIGGPKPGGPATPAKKSPWRAVKDEASGQTYYYNDETQASQWEKPADM